MSDNKVNPSKHDVVEQCRCNLGPTRCELPFGHLGPCATKEAQEIERLTRELKVQKAVNDLAYRPHQILVESRDALRAERDRLRALLSDVYDAMPEELYSSALEARIEAELGNDAETASSL